MKYLPFLLLTILFSHGGSFAEMRYWRQADGSVFEGEYLRQKLGNAYFAKPDGKTTSIEIAKLVKSDKEFIVSMVPPEVDIKVRTSERAEKGTYADTNTKYVDAKVMISKVGRKPFAGTLDAEIYLLRQEIDVEPETYRMMIKRKVNVKFPDTKKPSVEYELSAKIRFIGHPGQDRGWEYDGYLVVILDRGGEVLQTRTDLNWLDDEELEKFRALEPYQFFDATCKKKSAPRPKYYSGRTL